MPRLAWPLQVEVHAQGQPGGVADDVHQVGQVVGQAADHGGGAGLLGEDAHQGVQAVQGVGLGPRGADLLGPAMRSSR